MGGLPILTEKGEDAKIISELAARHPGGHVKQKGFDIKLHQERGQDRNGAVSIYTVQTRGAETEGGGDSPGEIPQKGDSLEEMLTGQPETRQLEKDGFMKDEETEISLSKYDGQCQK